MAARQTTTRKKKPATRKKATGRRAATRERTLPVALDLPHEFDEFSKRVKKGLGHLERDIERARKDTVRASTRLLRKASHQLGRVEAMGERQWKRLTREARREALDVLHQLEKAIEAPSKRRKSPARKTARKTARKATRKTARKTTRKKAAKR